MGTLRDSFDVSVHSNEEILGELDAALIDAGAKIADRVDEAVTTGEGQEVTKALYLIPHLNNVLREMYATPKSRREAGVGKEEAGGKLADVRQLRNRTAPKKASGE